MKSDINVYPLHIFRWSFSNQKQQEIKCYEPVLNNKVITIVIII